MESQYPPSAFPPNQVWRIAADSAPTMLLGIVSKVEEAPLALISKLPQGGCYAYCLGSVNYVVAHY